MSTIWYNITYLSNLSVIYYDNSCNGGTPGVIANAFAIQISNNTSNYYKLCIGAIQTLDDGVTILWSDGNTFQVQRYGVPLTGTSPLGSTISCTYLTDIPNSCGQFNFQLPTRNVTNPINATWLLILGLIVVFLVLLYVLFITS